MLLKARGEAGKCSLYREQITAAGSKGMREMVQEKFAPISGFRKVKHVANMQSKELLHGNEISMYCKIYVH